MERKRLERERERQEEEEKKEEARRRQGVRSGGLGLGGVGGSAPSAGRSGSDGGNNGKVVFVSKKRRAEAAAAARHNGNNGAGNKRPNQASSGAPVSSASSSAGGRSASASEPTPAASHLTAAQIASIKKSYLGESALEDAEEEEKRRRQKLDAERRARRAKKITFKFEWDKSEDTSKDEADPLYNLSVPRPGLAPIASLNGRFDRNDGNRNRRRGGGRGDHLVRNDDVATVDSCLTKKLDKMTTRDWRIFRENFDIVVKGGKAPPPLRSFRETPLGVPSIHRSVIEAIEQTLKYKEPSPIQRQAIPIGLQRRDLIGIAETGSGKTAAFGIPLLHHILTLPSSVLGTVADDGPLALVMAPTRELALQIDAEIAKLLSMQRNVTTLAVVGGQPIQQQAYKLRNGVHVVVGTPGRINDCVEMAYLVLNQCSYIVLDEADRMIDLGFAPQIEQILDAMGGLLKSEDETEAYRQEREDLEKLGQVVPRHRLTAMFSATMPPEVERIAKRYLRHPAIVTIGDQDSGKNARITQRVLFLSSPSQKENALRDILHRTRSDEKIIVFVNEKKHADGVGRMVEKAGKRCVVLHGGKTQEQREENLDMFRRGGVVLVATDVAGRGLDIPNVSHIVNFDVPSRSIDNYCHRIGRTGRAGKEGLATSFITDADEGIMAPLKSYLESTGMPVPDRLARHPAAVSGAPGGMIR